jgi:hypothetical protein
VRNLGGAEGEDGRLSFLLFFFFLSLRGGEGRRNREAACVRENRRGGICSWGAETQTSNL